MIYVIPFTKATRNAQESHYLLPAIGNTRGNNRNVGWKESVKWISTAGGRWTWLQDFTTRNARNSPILLGSPRVRNE
jgi:hypothetical protein